MRARELRSVRPRHDDPDLPADVEARDLPKEARVELKTLSKDNADWVAQHLVMSARLIDSDPELAHLHALSAARRAGRIGVVRETLAITAYATGDFALALRELRTYRRITGSNDQIALMVDSERGVGRPDRALELGRSVDRSGLPSDVQVSLAIAMSGARLDLGQEEAALAELEIPQLDPNRAFSWSPDLFHAYAEVLEALGRDADAESWRERAERAELALEEAHTDAELETVHVIEEELELAVLIDDADAFEDADAEDGIALDHADDETVAADETADEAVAEEPAADGSIATESSADEVAADGFAADEVLIDETVVDDGVAEEAADESAADESAADESVTDEAVADEAVADEAVADEAVADEAVADEAVADESVADEAVADEAAADESVTDELVADGSVADESAADEPVADESAVDEAVVDEAVADEAVAYEAVAYEAVADEAVADESVEDEPHDGAVSTGE